MARSLLEVFNEEFTKEIKQARNYPEAYERATQKFELAHGFEPFESYDSFRLKKSRGRKR